MTPESLVIGAILCACGIDLIRFWQPTEESNE